MYISTSWKSRCGKSRCGKSRCGSDYLINILVKLVKSVLVNTDLKKKFKKKKSNDEKELIYRTGYDAKVHRTLVLQRKRGLYICKEDCRKNGERRHFR